MKTLVTGATGFIGSHLVETLSSRGHEVTCLVRKASSLKWIEGLDVRHVYGDCEDRESLLKAVKGFDIIFHLAGLTKGKRLDEFYRINTKGTENLLSALAETGAHLKRFVYLSSLAAVGPSRNGKPVNEDTEPRPVSDYGKSKLEAEAAVLKYKDRMPLTIIRPPAVYGPRDRDLYLFYRMLKKGIFPYWGKCWYSLIYVDDLVRGIIAAALAPQAEGETFFLSDDTIYTNQDIADAIAQAVGARPMHLRIPLWILPLIAGLSGRLSRKAGIINKDKARELCHPRWTCDPSKAKVNLGFLPNIKIKEGMTWTANWYRIHQWL